MIKCFCRKSDPPLRVKIRVRMNIIASNCKRDKNKLCLRFTKFYCFSFSLLMRPLNDCYLGALTLHFKKIELYWALSFFKISSHIFMNFKIESKRRNRNGSKKASGFATLFFPSNFQGERERENGV